MLSSLAHLKTLFEYQVLFNKIEAGCCQIILDEIQFVCRQWHSLKFRNKIPISNRLFEEEAILERLMLR